MGKRGRPQKDTTPTVQTGVTLPRDLFEILDSYADHYTAGNRSAAVTRILKSVLTTDIIDNSGWRQGRL